MPRWISCQGVWLRGILKPPCFASAFLRRSYSALLIRILAVRLFRSRRGARRARLPSVADAWQFGHTVLDQLCGRLHIHYFGGAGIAHGASAAHEQHARVVDLELRIVNAVVVVLRAIEHDRPALA